MIDDPSDCPYGPVKAMSSSISFGACARVVVLVGILSSCSQNHEARDAKEFVEKYTNAWKRENVEAIVSMEYDMKKFDASRIPPGKEATLLNYTLENVTKRVEDDIKSKGFAYRLSSDLKYVSEQHHGDHVHVRVAQGAANADIVLVRDGELLKLFPYPSWFDRATP
ncbi:MAG: hypothetical protein A2X66_00240 [Ignavibacteria bacterium GWA2_54_16]|nr:MAG: hypothetical protein A2X66_00240 [Ignavibacteria bacterium GWA2_54_16]